MSTRLCECRVFSVKLTLNGGLKWLLFGAGLLSILKVFFAPAIASDSRLVSPQMPLMFEQNQGQFDSKVKYLANGRGYRISLGDYPVIELFRYKPFTPDAGNGTQDEVDLSSRARRIVDKSMFAIRLNGANPDAKVIAENQAIAKTNYLYGLKPNWITGIANFKSIRYQEILKNVDVVYYGVDGRLEYDFVVKPGAKVNSIELSFDGVSRLEIDDSGQLSLGLKNHRILQRPPVAYQVLEDRTRVDVPVEFRLTEGRVGFKIGSYIENLDLVIDPVLEYSRYYGGSHQDTVEAVDVDGSDNIYIIGQTYSDGLATVGAYQETRVFQGRPETSYLVNCTGCSDSVDGLRSQRTEFRGTRPGTVYVSKFSPDGTTLIWSTYFSDASGVGVQLGVNSAAVSSVGEVAFGLTSDAPEGLPLVNATQTFSSSQNNVYVAKLNVGGDGLVFSTYLSTGPSGSWLRGLDVAADGSVAVSGVAADFTTPMVSDIRFPEINALSGQNCNFDRAMTLERTVGWIIRFDTLGTASFSSCLGGSVPTGIVNRRQGLRGVAIGNNGHLYALGYTTTTDFPVVNPIQANLSFYGYRDTTVTQIDPVESQIVFSTYLGPVTPGAARAASDFQTLANYPIDIAVDAQGKIFVVGTTNMTGWPTTKAFQPNIDFPTAETFKTVRWQDFTPISNEIYLTKIDPSTSSLDFFTFLGGSMGEHDLNTMTLDAAGNSYVFSLTRSDDYPLLNPIQSSKSGLVSPVISKFSPTGALVFSSYHGGTDHRIVQTPGGGRRQLNGSTDLGCRILGHGFQRSRIKYDGLG